MRWMLGIMVPGKIGENWPKLEKHMRKSLLVTLLMIALMTSACQGAESIAVEAPTETESIVSAEILPTETEPVDVEPVVDEPTPTAIKTLTGPTSECTLVSSLPEPSPEYADIFAVKDNDWTIGPKDAAVTIIEYGDFQ